MQKKPDGFQGIPLWLPGLLLIVGGIVAHLAAGWIFPIVGNSAADRGRAFGQGLVTGLCVLAGVALLVRHFVRAGSEKAPRHLGKRAKSDAGSVRAAGRNGRNSAGRHRAIGWGLLGLSLVLTILVPVGLFIANRQTDATKPLKSYPVTIAIPSDCQVVPADAKLQPGTRLQACWAEKWNPVTMLSENRDGNLTVRWDDFGEAFDCSMLRNELIINRDVLKESQAAL
ncbi:MAG: hypothetical protein ACKV0T_15725 [Planctomycetales bacterium]